MFDNLTGGKGAAEQNNTPAAPAGQQNTPTPDAPVPPPAQESAPVPPVDNTQSQTPNTPPPAGAPQGTTDTPAQPDVNAIFDKMSGGLIKDEAGFSEALKKIKEHGILQKERDDLAAQMAQAPVFADDEVRILNDLKRAGATKEQLKTFQKLNDYGTISEMTDRDALVASMVMKGTKESTALLKVERDFKLEDESLDPSERELLDDDLRVAALEARAELEKLKAKASDAAQLPPEEAKLQLEAKRLAHQNAVKPYVSDVVASLPNLGVYTLSPGKDGGEAVSISLPADDNVKAEIGEAVQNYFMDGLIPVTPETTIEALAYARAVYFEKNAEKLFQQAFDKGVSLTTEALVNKYENRSGLQRQVDAPPVHGANDAAATASFMTKVANRTL